MTRSEQAPVLVVGGGTVGLAAGLCLAAHGVPACVVERQAAPSIHPRAGGLGPRTLEIFRELGLAARVRAAGDGMNVGAGRVRAETLATANLAALPKAAMAAIGDASKAFSPEGGALCPQDRLDALLLEAARARGVDVRFDTELVELDLQDDVAVATLVDTTTSARHTVTTGYVIAADGIASHVRRLLDIGTTGPGRMGERMINVLFRANLRALTMGRDAVMCEITHPRAPGLLLSVGTDDRWGFHIAADTGADVRELVRLAVGLPDLDVDVLSVLPWQVGAQVADAFRCGPVFLAGDAAHVVPPLGAFGLNTGLADPHNLAWKIALVRAGRAGAGLLGTYDEERRPVAAFTMNHALGRMRNPELHFDHLHLESPAFRAARERLGVAHALVVHLGYRYASGAIVQPAPLPSLEHVEQALDGAPGSRLPHRWVERVAPHGPANESGDRRRDPRVDAQGDAQDGARGDHQPVSMLDLVRSRFTLLAGPRAGHLCDAARAVSARLGLDIGAVRLGPDGDFVARDVRWTDTVGIDEDGALLVRPDGFIAWRHVGGAADLGALFARVCYA
jgi:2-polyprenyl-6-methoxyphenol hydroxylase-like FAD-dependent oxidoreductase